MSNQPREISPFGFLDPSAEKNYAPVVVPAEFEDQDDELDPTVAPLNAEAVELLEGELAGAGGATSFGSSTPPSNSSEKSGSETPPVLVTPSSDTTGADLPKPSSPPVVPTPPTVQTPSSPKGAKTTPKAS